VIAEESRNVGPNGRGGRELSLWKKGKGARRFSPERKRCHLVMAMAGCGGCLMDIVAKGGRKGAISMASAEGEKYV